MQSSSTSSAHINKQSNPLGHFSFLSNSGNVLGNFLGNDTSSINNGTTTTSRGVNLSANSQNLVNSSIQSVNNLGATKPTTTGIASSQTSVANAPYSLTFSDSSKARHILSTGSVSLKTVENPVTVSPKQSVNQKLTPPRLVPSPQAGLSTTVRPKGSPLLALRPKGIVPRPQNASHSPGGQSTSQITIQGNVLTQGLKTTPMKGQPQLVAIRPKIVIAQSNTSGSGLNSQTNTGTSTVRPNQTLQNTFTLGAKGQLPKQILNTLTVPHLNKQGIPNQAVGKSGLANLVQLQPKQIAPKPEQVSTVQTGKTKLIQDQAHLQLVQSLLAQSQMGVQTNVGQKDLKQNLGQENLTQQQKIAQQNQLKKLLALQVRAQQQQLTQAQQAHTQQQQQHTQQQHTQANTQQQNMTLLQMKSPPSSSDTTVQQSKIQAPSSQTTINTANLASQLKEAINSKQLQQFLEKNPIVAQQLKQLNMRQPSLLGNVRQQGVTGNTVPISSLTPVKTVTQLQKPAAAVGQLQKGMGSQLQTVNQLQKSTLNQKQSLTIGQLQKPTIINQLPKQAATVTQLQKPSVSGMAHLQKVSTTNITQLAKPVTTSVTQATLPKKVVGIPSTAQVTHITIPPTGQSTSIQKSVTTQKVVIVQNATTGSVPTVSAGQPKVLLQTKEGRPILLSQEQFRQIQAQLASKNLSIQGKLVTAAPVGTTTATTVKPQVVVKSEASVVKVSINYQFECFKVQY